MTDLNKGLVAATNCNHQPLQMVAGSDVNVMESDTVVSSPVTEILPPENLPTSCNDNTAKSLEGIVLEAEYKVVKMDEAIVADLSKAEMANDNAKPPKPADEAALGMEPETKEEVDKAENASPFPDPTNVLAGDILPMYSELPVSNPQEDNAIVFTQALIDRAVSEYGLTDVIKAVPPSVYSSGNKKSIKASLQQLWYDLALKPALEAIPKRMGVHPGKGLPSRAVLLKYLYGFERYDIDAILKLDEIWVKRACKWALKKNRSITRHTIDTLKKQYEEKCKEAKKMAATEAKNKFYATLVENPQKADMAQLYNGAIVDLTQVPDKFDPAKMTLPLAENALVLVAVLPKELHKALALIKSWGLEYVDNVVWQRNKVKAGYVWSVNIHTNILVAVKGCPDKPIDYTRLQSISFDAQAEENEYLPDYYYSSLEALIPGGAYLEVFSTRQFSDQWFVFDPREADNV